MSYAFRFLTEPEGNILRRWARVNYEPGTPISPLWHPDLIEECEAINEEVEFLDSEDLDIVPSRGPFDA